MPADSKKRETYGVRVSRSNSKTEINRLLRGLVILPISNTMKLTQWRLKKDHEQRFKQGHPWVYSNELQASPKGHQPGALVELCNSGGEKIAIGYGNPHSLISFRKLKSADDTSLEDHLEQVLERAISMRERLGISGRCHRLLFAEADGIPGLIIDRYISGRESTLVLQAQTAGADRLLETVTPILKAKFSGTGILIKNQSGMRLLEGLKKEDPRWVVKGIEEAPFEMGGYSLRANLERGQKTGLFLDQIDHLGVMASLAQTSGLAKQKKVRVLDLFSYVGAWGGSISHALSSRGIKVEVTAVDASSQALSFAQENIEALGGTSKILEADLLEERFWLGDIKEERFDVVIADPPALIKSRKHIPVGKKAYELLMQRSMAVLRRDGLLVACSCSGLVSESEFMEILARAARRSASDIAWISQGSQSLDHPVLASFPEGRYLKTWIGVKR